MPLPSGGLASQIPHYGNAELKTIHSRNHWNFKNKSFLDYQITVSNFNEEQIKHCNIKDKEELIINHIRDSGKKHFYLGKGKFCMPKKKPWWNEEYSKAVALKNSLAYLYFVYH